MTVKFFWKKDCPKCPSARANVAKLGEVEYYNLDDPDGLAEAAYYSILSTPAVVISGADGRELVAFRGEIPPVEVLKQWLA